MFGFVRQSDFDRLKEKVRELEERTWDLRAAAMLVQRESNPCGPPQKVHEWGAVELVKQLADHIGCEFKLIPPERKSAKVEVVCSKEDLPI